MTKRVKIILGITGSAFVILIVAFFVLRWLVIKSFPTVDGSLTVSGLQDQVTVYRDEYGVPHIFAGNEHDLLFTQGYVHAQDRLWQMDLSRRAGEGRLSEIFGPSTIKFDKLLRTVGFRRIALRLEQNLHPESRAILQAYCDGVNEFIRTHKGKYPIEFDMLNYAPEEWTPLHSLLIARLMAWELNISWYTDIMLGELILAVGEEKAKEIFPTYPENAPVIVPKELRTSMITDRLSDVQDIDRELRLLLGSTGTHIGSNSWVIGPEKSLTGKALLANDPHLAFASPSKWYEVHLSGGVFNVAGASLAGTPMVIIGHTPAIAWGLTNVMADDADFYIEKEDSLQADHYLFKGQSLAYSIIMDTIFVKDSAFVPITIRSTIHGPIVNDLNQIGGLTCKNPISMRWTGQDISDELYAIYRINGATNWTEFLQGVKEFTVPGQNFVYADASGNIGYAPGVHLPIRPVQNPTIPLPGWTGQYEWSGYVPFEKLPHLYNPPEHFIATANNKTTDASYPYHISNLWEPPSRIERIREVISAQEKISTEDIKRLQMDYYSHFARELVPYIVHAYDSIATRPSDIETALTYFKNWNFQMTRDDVPTAILHVFFTHLMKNIYQDEMGDTLFQKYIFLANIPYRVTLSLLQQPASTWFDNRNTPETESRDFIIRKSLTDAISDLQKSLGGELKNWRWGKLHTITFRHPFGSKAPLGPVFNVGPFPAGGSGTTVNNGEYRFTDPYAMVLGPSLRQIVDFSALDQSLSVLPTGQSGQPLNDHYSDQTPLWLNGGYHSLPITRDGAVKIAKHTLILQPSH
jgi:penicillin amidase